MITSGQSHTISSKERLIELYESNPEFRGECDRLVCNFDSGSIAPPSSEHYGRLRPDLIPRYLQDSKWRNAWNSLMNNQDIMRKKYRLQSQLEKIERKAQLANIRIGRLMEASGIKVSL